MHELAVTQSVIDIVVKHAKEAGAKKIEQVNLVLGDMSGLVDDSIQFYFDFLTKDTPAAGAKLNFKRVPMTARCRACGEEFKPDSLAWQCPKCDKWDVEIIAGKEFLIESIEVDDDRSQSS